MELQSYFENMVNDFEVTWIVNNFSMITLSGEIIFSPILSLPFLSTKWRLHLQYLDNKVLLERCQDDGPEIVCISVVSVVTIYNRIVKHAVTKAFKRGDVFPILHFRRHVTLNDEKFIFDSSTDEMIIRCNLSPYSEYYIDYFQLSLNMQYNWLMNSEFSDAVLCTPNMGDVPVHRAILHARAPDLKMQGEIKLGTDILRIDFPNFNVSEFALLQFIYSGQVDSHVYKTIPDLDANGLSSDTFGIKKTFDVVPHNYAAKTVSKIRRKDICFYFFDKDAKIDTRIRTFVTFGINWRLEVRFTKTRAEKYGIRLIPYHAPAFHILVIRYLASVCCVCSNRKLGDIINGSVIHHGEIPRRGINSMITVKEHSVPNCCGMRYFNFYLNVWNGNCSYSFEAKVPKKLVYDILPDVLSFSADMLKLFESSVFYDTNIEVPDGKIEAHRAILSARSPVFAAMFRSDMIEASERVVHILDFEKSVMYKLIKYIYCAQVEFENTEEAIQLAYAADKYRVELLKNKCFLYLENNLNRDNAIQIYITCYLLEQKCFKDYVKSYIQRSEPLSETQLDDFRQNWPDLYLEVFPPKICLPAQSEMINSSEAVAYTGSAPRFCFNTWFKQQIFKTT